MFILSSISNGLEFFFSVNHTSIYGNSESKVFKNIKFLGETSNNWPNDLLGTNVYKTLESCWWSLLTILQCTNTTSLISKWGLFPPISSLVILLLVLPSNFNVSALKVPDIILSLF